MPNSLFDSNQEWDLKTLIGNYNKGFKGSYFDTNHYHQFMSSLPMPLFGAAAPHLANSGKGKVSTPFKSVLFFDPNAYEERQVTGDCTDRTTEVKMADGSYKMIPSVNVGDEVISHTGEKRKVISILKKPYNGDMYRIELLNSKAEVILTPDHKIVVYDKEGNIHWKTLPELMTPEGVKYVKASFDLQKDYISKIELIENIRDDVYCIGVDEDHSFLANNISVSNCVSHANRNAADITRAVQIHIHHSAEGWLARGATEAIYGSRGHGGAGMACSQAADFLHRKGGIVLRQKFASVDLSKYTGMTGAGWGARGGVPQDILEIARKHQIQTVSLIKTIDEARDALANGYGLACCSNQGFSSVRDSKGFARPQGSWSHAMMWSAVDDTGSEPAFLVQNSWACLASDTQILTDQGWKHFYNLNKTEAVATLNPNTHELEYQYPTEYHEFDVDTELYHYKWRGIDLKVTNNHNIYMCKHWPKDYRTNPERWYLQKAEDIKIKNWRMKKNANWIGEEIEYHECGPHKIKMDNWLAFLGLFISEGWTLTRKYVMSEKTGHNCVTNGFAIGVSQKKKENLPIIKKVLEKLPFKIRETFSNGEQNGFVFHDKYVYNELRPLGKATKKYIPDYFRILSSRQLKILYKYLMLGDGSRESNDRNSSEKVTYYTSSKRLANEVQELILKIGHSANISIINRIGRDISAEGRSNITRELEYQVRIQEKCCSPCKRGNFGIEKVPYKGKVYCVTVPNHIIYVRRNGKAVWTGNSWNSGGQPDWGPIPNGSFLIHTDVAARMLAAGGTFVFSNAIGYPSQKLPDYGTKSFL